MSDLWAGADPIEHAELAVGMVSRLVRQRFWSLIGWMLLCLVGAAAIVHVTTPEYTATAAFMLAPRVVASDGPELIRQYRQMELDLRQIETQIAIVQSTRVLRNVFAGLDLATSADIDPAHDHPVARFFRRWHAVWTGEARPDDDQARFRRFVDRVRVRRLGLSYIIDVSYRSLDPDRAARVANAIVSGYAAERIRRTAPPPGVTP